MKAAEAFGGHSLPRKCFGQRTLRECKKSGKRDSVVLIEVDCDDFGDVIILDVPEAFQQKFRKNANHHVISIDDDDGNGESRGGVCDVDNDGTTGHRFSPTSAASSSNCNKADEDCLFVNEVNTPVKLSKSKRTYCGETISRNRYGLHSDSESCSSDSDCSDCELMEGSFGKLREQWEKASRRRHDTTKGHSISENKAGTSAFNDAVHNNAEEGAVEHSVAPTHERNMWSSLNNESNDCLDDYTQKLAEESKSSEHYDAEEMGGLSTRGDRCNGSSDLENKTGISAPGRPTEQGAQQSAAEHSVFPSYECCFRNSLNHDNSDLFGDSAEDLAEQSKSVEQDFDANEIGELFPGDYSTYVPCEPPYRHVDSCNSASFNREHGDGSANMSFDHNSINDHSEAKSSPHQSNLIIDRQKIKETDEYKRAMEEEWASRQQQLRHQADEARRLRSRKRAEIMRIMANERRKKQRLEEIRETRRKDEENLNLKDKLRVEIRKELGKLETTCGDMASLLRSLGIHVGGGLCPSPNEVQAAYKQACLRFHPDRSSRADLRQQVEAEEKFKLISTMKDKFILR